MATFALVHGAWVDSWFWSRVSPHLEKAGHRVVAPDLPTEDPEADFSTYAGIVSDALGDADDAIVVGWSLGGLTIPLVAVRRPVAHLVYIGALVPEPGRSLNDQLRRESGVLDPALGEARIVDADGFSRLDPARWAAAICHDCDAATQAEAAGHLRRQSQAGPDEPCPLPVLPATPTTYVLCRDDRSVTPAWSRRVARERLAVEPVEIDGGHSPMLGRPRELADVLLSTAA